MTVNPHDAEEALRPYLGRVHEAVETRNPDSVCSPFHTYCLEQALGKALDLLGVQA